jgi:hypothetical protein
MEASARVALAEAWVQWLYCMFLNSRLTQGVQPLRLGLRQCHLLSAATGVHGCSDGT